MFRQFPEHSFTASPSCILIHPTAKSHFSIIAFYILNVSIQARKIERSEAQFRRQTTADVFAFDKVFRKEENWVAGLFIPGLQICDSLKKYFYIEK